jgi:nicotinamide-nucleotide amidase
VTYNATLKSRVLKIPEDIIEKHTAESRMVTVLMAKNLSRQLKADVSVAITGLDSPGGSETKDKPVGTVFIAVFYEGKTHYEKKLFRGSPQQVRKKATEEMVRFVMKVVGG